jgi:spermidine synthase
MASDFGRKPFSLRVYLLIAFIEGGAVMVVELLSARMIAPFYGTTLFVWSTVIGLTLAALALGYFAGGYLGDRYPRNNTLFSLLAIASVLIALMPILAPIALEATSGMGVRTGSLVSGLIFLFPPIAALGTTSPIIIRLASSDVQHSGRTVGTVYAVSTVSGILTTFFLGFYVIPTWGITNPAFFTAAVLGLFPLYYFLKARKYFRVAALLLVLTAAPLVLLAGSRTDAASQWQILYKSEGLLGQVIVADHKMAEPDAVPTNRVIFVNRQPQTNANVQAGYSNWLYVHALAVAASIKPAGSSALILGLGGGSVADEFLRLGFQVDAVELDERIAMIAEKYFHLDPKCRSIVDDARHFLRTTQNTYDIIVYDTFSGEQPPPHLLTLENFLEAQRKLKPGGLLIINFTGFLSGDAGLAARSVLRTMQQAGFHVRLLPTPGREEDRNLLFVGSSSEIDFSLLSRDRQNDCCRDRMKVPIPLPFLESGSVDLRDALVLTDERPVMETMHLRASETWRKEIIHRTSTQLGGLPLF